MQTLSRLHTLVSTASHLSVPCCCYVPHNVVPLPWSYSGSGSVAMHATAHFVGVVFLSTCPCRLLPTATLNSSTDSGVCSMLCTQGLPLAAERIAGSASRGRMASHSDKKQRWCLTLGPYHNRLPPPQHRGGSNASESIEYRLHTWAPLPAKGKRYYYHRRHHHSKHDSSLRSWTCCRDNRFQQVVFLLCTR